MEQQTAAAEVEEGKKKCCELTTPGGSKVSGCCAPCCWCCCVVVCEPMLSSAQVDKVIQKKSEAMIKRTVTQTLRDVVVTTGDAPTGESMERERGLTLSVRQAGDTSQRTSIAPPRASSDGGEIELARSKSKFSKSTGLEEGWGRPTDAAEPAIAAETAGPDPPMDHMEEWSVIDDGSDMKRERAESVKMIEPLNLVSGPEEADVFDPSLMSREQAGSESERIAVDLMQRKDDTAACEAAVSKLAAIGAAFKVDAKYPCPLIPNEGASQSMFTALSHLLAHGTDEAMQHASIAICHLLEQTPPIKSRTPTFIATLEKLGPAMIYFVAQSRPYELIEFLLSAKSGGQPVRDGFLQAVILLCKGRLEWPHPLAFRPWSSGSQSALCTPAVELLAWLSVGSLKFKGAQALRVREWLRKEATDTTLISSLAEAQDPTATNTMLKEQSMGLIAEALSAFAGDRGKVVGLMSHHLAREICNLLEKNAFFNSTRAKAFTLITNLVESPKQAKAMADAGVVTMMFKKDGNNNATQMALCSAVANLVRYGGADVAKLIAAVGEGTTTKILDAAADKFSVNQRNAQLSLPLDAFIAAGDAEAVAWKAAWDAKCAEKAEAQGAAFEKKGGPKVALLWGFDDHTLNSDPSDCYLELGDFTSHIAEDALVTSGIAYYEVTTEISGSPQVGFASPAMVKDEPERGSLGIGDLKGSWGLNGPVGVMWAEGEKVAATAFKYPRNKRAVLGVACDVDHGAIAYAIDGEWVGVAVRSDELKQGVFPAWTGDGKTRYNLDGKRHGPWSYGPPSAKVFA